MRLVSRLAIAFIVFAFPASAQNWSIGAGAGVMSWNESFSVLQTPGWTQKVHPVGILDVQYKHLFVEFSGDPHRKLEASTMSAGMRFDAVKFKRNAIYLQASVGSLIAPSFLEYCGGYEYKPDCHAGNEDPEYCWWWSTNVGVGWRVKVNKRFAIEALKVEYMNPYAIGPRWRLTSGFRFYVK